MEGFSKIYFIDTEYRPNAGDLVAPVCITAKELISGEIIQLRCSDTEVGLCPLPLGDDVLFIVFYAGAESSYWSAMKWPRPANVIDLYVEHRVLDNLSAKGFKISGSLLGVLARRGLFSMEVAHKDSLRDLILSKEEYSESEWVEILKYNFEDVVATEKLFSDMYLTGQIDIDRALIRGLFSWITGEIEAAGIPIDVATAKRLQANWDSIELKLIEQVDKDFNIYDGKTFKRDRFVKFLVTNKIPWEFNEKGIPLLDDDTFKTMSKMYPQIQPLRELRRTLSQFKIKSFPLGSDGRTRTGLRPFSSMTSRNQPRTSENIFGGAKCLRSLIKPTAGMALAIIDQSQQEFGIAAALSGDENMKEAYRTGDPYLTFGKQAGAIPDWGTKATHGNERDLYKACVLAVQYGMGAESLAKRIGKDKVSAEVLLNKHKSTYKSFWSWQERILEHASIKGHLYTTLGWEIKIDPVYNKRSVGNFLMQANGAEILRVATIIASLEGIKINSLIHDAIVVEAPIDQIDAVVAVTQKIFSEASGLILNGFQLRSDAQVIKYPDRYHDEKGKPMWELLMRILNEVDGGDHESRSPS